MRVRDIVFAVGMLAAGTVNTISSRLQDGIKSVGLPHTEKREFAHPGVQTLAMFMGESLCMIAFLATLRSARRHTETAPLNGEKPNNQKFPIWTFGLPAMCDMTGSTLMYIGLLWTTPSVYQMLRGMIVVFTGLFSWLFLGRKLYKFHLLGMFLIIVGTAIVGVASVLNSKGDAKHPIPGNSLIIVAQLIAATQMVLEEKFIGKYNVPPLQVVGNEGLWGFSVTLIILFVMYWIPPIREIDNSKDAMYQIIHSMPLLGTLILSIFSIAFLNFFGISVTKYLSATHRTTIDATRTVLVWIVSLLVGWEKFSYIQLIGFAVLLCGTSIFNEIVRLPRFEYPVKPAVVIVNDPSINEEKQKLLG